MTKTMPHVDPLALFDSIAATETARVEADEARIAFENKARLELRDTLFTALDTLFKSRELHYRWTYSGNPPRLFVCHTSLSFDAHTRCGPDIALRITGDAHHKCGGVAIRAMFDQEAGEAYLVRVHEAHHAGDTQYGERFDNWIAAYESLVREIASDMADNASDKRRMAKLKEVETTPAK